MKKTLSILAIAVLMVSMMSVNAFAHGGHGSSHRTTQQSGYAVCTVEGCAENDLHEHNGAYYYCQNHSTGHGCGRTRSSR